MRAFRQAIAMTKLYTQVTTHLANRLLGQRRRGPKAGQNFTSGKSSWPMTNSAASKDGLGRVTLDDLLGYRLVMPGA